jgi:hypothetical protein
VLNPDLAQSKKILACVDTEKYAALWKNASDSNSNDDAWTSFTPSSLIHSFTEILQDLFWHCIFFILSLTWISIGYS